MAGLLLASEARRVGWVTFKALKRMKKTLIGDWAQLQHISSYFFPLKIGHSITWPLSTHQSMKRTGPVKSWRPLLDTACLTDLALRWPWQARRFWLPLLQKFRKKKETKLTILRMQSSLGNQITNHRNSKRIDQRWQARMYIVLAQEILKDPTKLIENRQHTHLFSVK